MGPPGVHSLASKAPIFISEKEMGAAPAMFGDLCVCVRKVLSVPERHDVQTQHDDLRERLARMELLTQCFHMQPGGLSKRPPEP